MRKTLGLLILVAVSALGQEQTPQQLYDQAIAEYKRSDFQGYLASMEALAAKRPGLPVVLFNYAGALALNGRPADAVAQLGRIADRMVVIDLGDHDLDSLRARDDFRAVQRRFDDIRVRKISSSSIAFRIPQKDLITESIAYDPKTKSFFVSSVRKRKILRLDARGQAHDFVTRDIWAAGGLAVDSERRVLWASSGVYDRVEGFDKKYEDQTSLFAFNADSGALIARYELPPGGKHFFDGVSVDRDGTVFVSDAFGGALYRLRPGQSALELFVAPGTMRSPQASTVARGALYVADYGGPIWVVDPKSGVAAKLEVPDDLVTAGTDGLDYGDGSLLLVQNGIQPNRVVRVWLDPAGRKALRWRILEMNHPLMDEPTNGVVVGHDFYWLAASQGHLFDAKPPALDKMHDGIVMKTPLR